MRHFHVLSCGALALSLGACSTFDRTLGKVDAAVGTYAPIVGRDLVRIADIVVRAECAPALATTSASVTNVLTIVAPNAHAAQTVVGVLQRNVAITQQLCPLVASVHASIGPVPQGATPTQVVPAAAPAARL